MTSIVSIEIKGMKQETVETIANMLATCLDDDTPIELVFLPEVGYQSYTAGIALYQLIRDRPNTKATALDSLIGPQLLPFVGCKVRCISDQTEICLQPPAYPKAYAREQLIEYIENNFGFSKDASDYYCHANHYEQLSVTLFETASRMQMLEAQQIVILSEHTTIPEAFYAETLPKGYDVSLDEAIEWQIATDVIA